MPLDNFAFVLFRPKAPGNIGASARALKNMGLRDLRIVSRTDFQPVIPASEQADRIDATAKSMAVHAEDILAAIETYAALDSALADRTMVVGTTARPGLYRSESRPIREVSAELMRLSEANRIAIVFGPEDCGLTNDELKACQRLVTIPTAPDYRSLNLAQAVMIIAYELMLAAGAARESGPAPDWARFPEVDEMLERLAEGLVAIGFLPEDNPDHIMFALRAILGRAGLRPRELKILNGIARQIFWFAKGGHETLAKKRAAGKKLK
jgi:tRNA/rRNA methyltransferase